MAGVILRIQPEEAVSTTWATSSDKTAREEFGFTDQAIALALRAGKLQRLKGFMRGESWIGFSGERPMRWSRQTRERLRRGAHCEGRAKTDKPGTEAHETQIAKSEERKSRVIADIRN